LTNASALTRAPSGRGACSFEALAALRPAAAFPWAGRQLAHAISRKAPHVSLSIHDRQSTLPLPLAVAEEVVEILSKIPRLLVPRHVIRIFTEDRAGIFSLPLVVLQLDDPPAATSAPRPPPAGATTIALFALTRSSSSS